MGAGLGRRLRGFGAVGLVALVLPSACSYLESAKILNRYELEGNDVLLTGAEYRAVVSTNIAKGDYRVGHVIPRVIRCAEPSPDIAKAIGDAFKLDVAGKATIESVPFEARLAAERQRAEALAQLGERLATIQMLRDGLFRACEAYSNGALGAVNYGAILTAYDDLMVTLLTGELVAGAFGRSLAGASASASVSGTAAQAALRNARAHQTSIQSRQDAVKSEIGSIDARMKEASTTDKQKEELTKRRAALVEDDGKLTKDAADATTLVDAAAAAATREAASGTSNASTGNIVPGGGLATLRDTSKVAETLRLMHSKFIDGNNERSRTAMVFACANALSRVAGTDVDYDGSRIKQVIGVGKDGRPQADGYSMFTAFCANSLMPEVAKNMVGTGLAADMARLGERVNQIESRFRPPARRAPPARPGDPKTPPTNPDPTKPGGRTDSPGHPADSTIAAEYRRSLGIMETRSRSSLCSLLSAGVRDVGQRKVLAQACPAAFWKRS